MLGKDSQATTGGTDVDDSDGNRWKPKQMDEEREKPRHCAVCKAELTHLCGTHRPTVPVVLDMVWEDMVAALDVWPNSYRVRTYEDVYLDGLKARLAEQAACALKDGELRRHPHPKTRFCATPGEVPGAATWRAGAGRCRWRAGTRHANASSQRASRRSILEKLTASTMRHASVLSQHRMFDIQTHFFNTLLWACG